MNKIIPKLTVFVSISVKISIIGNCHDEKQEESWREKIDMYKWLSYLSR